jgi:hypothetical protein
MANLAKKSLTGTFDLVAVGEVELAGILASVQNDACDSPGTRLFLQASQYSTAEAAISPGWIHSHETDLRFRGRVEVQPADRRRISLGCPYDEMKGAGIKVVTFAAARLTPRLA